MHLPGINNWGLCQPHRLQGDTGSHLFIHTKVNKGRVAPPPSSLPLINLQQDTPSEMDSSNKEDFPTALSVWCKEPVSNRQWLYIHLIPCSSITGHTPRPATHPHELFMKRYPQKQNWWMPQCQMTYQMSLILPKNNFTQIIYLG